MKIKETRARDEDYRDLFRLETEGGQTITIGYMEPEDATLGRDLKFAYSILELMYLAYEAGKRGEAFEVEKVTVSDEEFWA